MSQDQASAGSNLLDSIVTRGDAAQAIRIPELHALRAPVEVHPSAEGDRESWRDELVAILGETRGRVVAVTSERSTLSASLALALAEALADQGATVTVVDAFIEEPLFAKGLPDDGDEGLVDAVLFGISSSTVARRTLMGGVRLVTTGAYPLSVAAVFASDAYAKTLHKLAREDATAIVVIPPEYVPVAAAPAAHLVIADRDIERLARLTSEMRQVEDLRGVRFAAVYAGPDHAEAVEKPQPAEPVVLTARRQDAEESSAEDEGPGRVDEAQGGPPPGEMTGREPAAGATHSPPQASTPRREQSRLRDREPPGGGRRTAAVITLCVLVLAVAVAWRSGFLGGLFDGFGAQQRVDQRQAETEQTGRTDGEQSGSDGERSFEGQADEQPGGDATTPDVTGTTGGEGSVEGGNANRVDTADRPVEAEAGTPEADDALDARDWRDISETPARPGQYIVFTTSHATEEAAGQDAARLERRGFPATVVRSEVSGRGIWYRVAVDAGFSALADMNELLDIMKQTGYEGAWPSRFTGSVEPQPAGESALREAPGDASPGDEAPEEDAESDAPVPATSPPSPEDDALGEPWIDEE